VSCVSGTVTAFLTGASLQGVEWVVGLCLLVSLCVVLVWCRVCAVGVVLVSWCIGGSVLVSFVQCCSLWVHWVSGCIGSLCHSVSLVLGVGSGVVVGWSAWLVCVVLVLVFPLLDQTVVLWCSVVVF